MTGRKRSGWGKNSWRDPDFWCFRCSRCGRKGTRDYVPMLLSDREYWREHGSSSEGLHNYPVVCRWDGPCNRRYFAKLDAEAVERAKHGTHAGENDATRAPVDLDALQDQMRSAPDPTECGGQTALW